MQHIIVHTTTTILVGCVALGIFWHDSNLDKATSYALARPGQTQTDASSNNHKAEGPTSHQHTHHDSANLQSVDPREKRRHRLHRRLAHRIWRDHIHAWEPRSFQYTIQLRI